VEIERQHKLFEAGVTSRDVYDQAQQAFDNTKADYESAVGCARRRKSNWPTTPSARRLTASWATFRCMWATMFRPTTMLTTVDENKDLEAYIYVPTERAGQVRMGLGGPDWTTTASCWRRRRIDFHFAAGGQHAAGDPGEGAGAFTPGFCATRNW
jgi:hypothetical protein